MQKRTRSRALSPIIVVPWILIAIVAILAFLAVQRINKETFRSAGKNKQDFIRVSGLNRCLAQIPPGTTLTVSQFQTCLQSSETSAQVFDEEVGPGIDELKWLLTIIAAIGAFFAIAQGAAAWFSAQAYTKQAEDGLNEIESVQDAIRARYPLFDHIETVRKQVISALNDVFAEASKVPDSWRGNTEALDWEDNLYRKLGVEARQLLLSVESFASIDLDPGFSSEEHADILRKFSLFYKAKFLFEDGVLKGTFCDLERAESYLVLASTKSNDFTIMNELGSLYATIYLAVCGEGEKATEDAKYYLEMAENKLEKSSRLEPHQQRAYHGIAVIYGRHRKDYNNAVIWQQKAIENKVWQRKPSEYMQAIIYYNMACYKSRLLQAGKTQIDRIAAENAGEVIEYLTNAAKLSYVPKDILDRDFAEEATLYTGKEKGDFSGLLRLADEALSKKLQALKLQLLEKAKHPTPPSPTPRQDLAQAKKLAQRALSTWFNGTKGLRHRS